MTTLDQMTQAPDAELVARVLAGDRDAFSRIVERYQTLVCSLAYNILGNLGESEDAAQETFIVAWKHLRRLREPAKLRAWLCGIAHNRARDRVRRDQRQAVAGAEPIDAAHHVADAQDLPSERAITQEEQAILWRALCRMPETYREPLILFYREQRSVERVAEALELTPDAVKQRLSRGRKLLHQEIIEFVEETLGRTAPNKKFTAGVLSALPAAPGVIGAGTGVATAKGAAAKSSGMLAMIFGSAASAAALLAGLGGQWLILRMTPTPSERRVKMMWFGAIWLVVIGGWLGQPALHYLARRGNWSEERTTVTTAVYFWLMAAALATLAIGAFRWILASRARQARETGQPTAAPPKGLAKILLLTTLVYGANVWWLMAMAWRAGDEASAFALAVGTAGLAALHFWRVRGKNGDKAMAVHASQVALVWGLMLAALNFRLDDWNATLRGMTLAQWHSLLPPWIVPSLTAALLAWAGAVLWLTRPRGEAFRATAAA